MEIKGVPESITRADYQRLIASTGLELNRIRALEFRTNGIYVEVHATHPDGRHFIITADGYDRDECATHRIFIPVVD